MRPTLVFRTVWSVEIFSRLAIFACLLFVESIAASAAPGVLPRRCKGMREYVRKPPPFPLARDAQGLANAALRKHCLCWTSLL